MNCRFRSWGGGEGGGWDRDRRLDIAKEFVVLLGLCGDWDGMSYIGREDGGMIVQGRGYGGLPDYNYSGSYACEFSVGSIGVFGYVIVCVLVEGSRFRFLKAVLGRLMK